MVTLPKRFTATRYPGYFWDVKNQKLYSIKIGGELRELKLAYPTPWRMIYEPGYDLSVKGRKRFYPISKLKKLQKKDSKIKVVNREK